jgi:Ser/Thr protein kinase RdoA (MazF antagonist)
VAVTELHAPFDSLEDMLSVETMSALEQREVDHIELEQWQPGFGAVSGCQFLKLRSCGPGVDSEFFVKRSTYATDMVRRLTDDHAGREQLIWQHGLLDRLPEEIDCPIVASARDGDGWALLMRDVSASLRHFHRQPAGHWHVLSKAQLAPIVDALATLHANFYCEPLLRNPALGLCTPHQMYTWVHPARLEREATTAPGWVSRKKAGWALLDRLAAPDVAGALQQFHNDPTPLTHALARYPATLVHGDPKRENLGLTTGSTRRLVLIDWQFVAALPPTVDLAWMLMFCEPIDVSKEYVIDRYYEQLSRRLGDKFDERTWEPQLRLGLLGQAVRQMGELLWAVHHQTTDTVLRDRWVKDLAWWCEQARAALKWL